MHLRLLCVTLLAAPVVAQGSNCTLLGTHHLHGAYSNIWGYVAPNGKEYALLGARTGTAVIDCSIPTAPVERGFFPAANSSWRELQVYQQYCYVCTEAAGGFQVIDLTNADAPVLVGTVGAQYFNNCHTISVDQTTGRIYCNGTSAGTVVFDASVTPASPTYVGTASTTYWHDFHGSNGWGYASLINSGNLRIVDLTTPLPFPAVSNTPTPLLFTHNSWPNASHTLLVTTDERPGAMIKLWDITNKAAPVPLGHFSTAQNSMPHNAYIIGNLCHVAWYSEGYRCIDISDPMNPFEIAGYDTWPAAPSGFNGAWGIYPFQPSGNIYIMDTATGLYVVKPIIPTASISHTALGNSTSEDGPYVVNATMTSSNTVSAAVLHWSTDGTNFTPVPMTHQGGNQYQASIPGQYAPADVRYHLTATDATSTVRHPRIGEHQFLVGSVQRVLFDDFETDQGWTHGTTLGVDEFQRGAPRGLVGASASLNWQDPLRAYSGTTIWGTDLGGPGFNGMYPNNIANWLQSPSVPTGGVQGLKLRYRRWLGLAALDTARVLVNGLPVFTTTAAVWDTSWQLIEHDISSITNSASTVTIRFEITTNATNVSAGWNIDDVDVFLLSDQLPPVHYCTGTPGTGSITPVIGQNGAPQLGQTYSLEGTSLLGGAASLLGLSFQSANISIVGITGCIDPSLGVFLFTMAGGAANQPGAGTASWPQSVPNNVLLDNLSLYTQVLVLDPGSPGGLFSASDGMRIRVSRY